MKGKILLVVVFLAFAATISYAGIEFPAEQEETTAAKASVSEPLERSDWVGVLFPVLIIVGVPVIAWVARRYLLVSNREKYPELFHK